jgi:hypothetical protein
VNDPENQLLLCCVRHDVDAPTAGRIRALVEGDLDWTRLIREALRHRITDLLYRSLRESCPDEVPEALLDALRVHVEQNAARARTLADELLAIVAECEGRSVTVIPFKGPTLAALAFGDFRLRTYGDLDLMVREQDVPEISDVLTARGYDRDDVQDPPLPEHLEAAYRRYERQIVFVRRRDGVVIEPQWAVTTRMLAFAVDYEALRARAAPIDFEGRRVMSYALEDLLLLLCIHGIKHYWCELRWVADIGALIDARPLMDLELCLRRAEAQGCGRVVLLGLALSQAVLGTVLPGPVRRRIDGDSVCRDLVAETIDGLFREDYVPPQPLLLTSYRMRVRERLRDRALWVWRTIFTPRVPHFGLVRLPPALSFLYYPIKIVHDYVLLPGWLAVRSVRSQSPERQS